MILSHEVVASLKRSKHGQEFVNGVRGELLKLELVSGMPDLTAPMDVAVETLGRRRAIEILKGILEPFYEPAEEKKEEDEKEVY